MSKLSEFADNQNHNAENLRMLFRMERVDGSLIDVLDSYEEHLLKERKAKKAEWTDRDELNWAMFRCKFWSEIHSKKPTDSECLRIARENPDLIVKEIFGVDFKCIGD